MTSKLDLEPTPEEIMEYMTEMGYDDFEVLWIFENYNNDPNYTDIACIAEQAVKQKKMKTLQKTD